MKFFTICFAVILVLSVQGILVNPVYAQLNLEEPPEGIPEGPTSGSNLIEIVENTTNWIFLALLFTATVFIVLAGFQFVTGGGDPNAVSEARRKILYATVAVVVGALAKAIPLAVRSIVGG